MGKKRSGSGKRKSQANMPAWKARRVQELRRRMMMGGAVAAALFLLLVIGIVTSVNKKNAQKEARDAAAAAAVSQTTEQTQTAESQTQESQTEASSVSAGSSSSQESAADSVSSTEESDALSAEAISESLVQTVNTSGLYNQASDETVDRSNFAVQPGVACGSDHNNGEKIVYLTLDDGPSYLTEQFLDVLDQYGVKATFFVTGQDPEYFYVIKEAYDRGHTIGLHSYSHDYETIYTSVEGYFDDLNKIGAVVEEQIGYVPCFIRFPGGEDNWISHDYCEGIMSILVPEVNEMGYQYYNWNCSSGDGGNITDVDELVANATSCDYPNVVLLSHDCGGKESTLEALPRIIEYYLSQGYVFKALDRDTFYCHAEVRN